MDPINQKEITSSFIQFMVLFLITVILAIVCVFFDQKFSQDSYIGLKKQLREANGQIENISFLKSQVDSLNDRIAKMDKLGEVEFSREKDKLAIKLNEILSSTTDSSNFQMLGISLKTTFENSMYDKLYFIKNRDCIEQIKNLNISLDKAKDETKQLQKDYDKLSLDYAKELRGK